MLVDSGRLFELRRRTIDTPEFRGIEFIEVEAKTVINHVPGDFMPFSWTINPYRGCSHGCVACFARPTHTYLDMNAGSDFERKIVVKVNAPDVLRRQLAARRWKGEHIALGTNTDPYQRAEGRYRLMPGIIRAMIEYRNPFSILTRGALMLRDLPLLVEANEVTEVSTAFSIPTLDEEAWRRTEPGAPHPRARMEAVAALNDAGVACGVMVAPLLPGITDDPEGIRKVVEAAIEAGATHVSPILLHLRPGVREEYMHWLGQSYPDLLPRYELMYRSSPYASPAARKEVGRKVATAVRVAGGIKPRPSIAARFRRGSDRRTRHPAGSKRREPRQLSLLRPPGGPA
jgi:DNA repair photolyase